MYDYREAIRDDIRNYIEENGIEEGMTEERLYDELWTEDSVTGNASGSYTFSRAQAERYVTENIDLLEEACSEFGMDDATVGHWLLSQSFETMDVTIRCYLLSACLHDVFEELDA